MLKRIFFIHLFFVLTSSVKYNALYNDGKNSDDSNNNNNMVIIIVKISADS